MKILSESFSLSDSMSLRRLGPAVAANYAYVIGTCVFVSILGCLIGDGHLYSRYRNEKCPRGVFDKNIKNSEFCCTGYHADDWVCVSAYDPVENMLTDFTAWIIPLVPLAIAGVDELLFATPPNRRNVADRMGIYILIFIYRTVF